MSTVIIGGGGTKAAVDQMVVLYPSMTANERAQAVQMLADFTDKVMQLLAAVEDRNAGHNP